VGKIRNAPRSRSITCARLEENELAALEVRAGPVEHGHHLQREGDVPVQILVERVVTALEVPQDQRRGTGLAGAMAELEEGVQPVGELVRLPEPARPVVCELCERRVEGAARLVDQLRQRSVEVPVPALAEAMPAHLDGGAEVAVLEAPGELLALRGAQDPGCLREALLVELRGEGGPVETSNAVGHGHTHKTFGDGQA
jgi:hypothetical protein